MCKMNFNQLSRRHGYKPTVKRIRVRVFAKDGLYEYYTGGRIIELRYGYADLVSSKGYYNTWRAYAKLLGTAIISPLKN